MQTRPRDGASIDRIYLHTSEGASTARDLLNFIQHEDGGYQAIADDMELLRAAPDDVIVEGEGGDNTHALALCFVAFARWSIDEWNAHPKMLAFAAQQVATWATTYAIPVVHVSPGAPGAAPTQRGIAEHADDHDPASEGHTDPGPGFPMDSFLASVNRIINPTPPDPRVVRFLALLRSVAGRGLRAGDRNSNVNRLNRVLRGHGYPIEGDLNFYGPSTVRAVAAFKNEHHMRDRDGGTAGTLLALALFRYRR